MINEQVGLYTLYLRGSEKGQKVDDKRGISSVSRCLNPYESEGFEEMMKVAVSDDLEIIVSNTLPWLARVFAYRVPVLWVLQNFTDLGPEAVGITMMVSNICVGVTAIIIAIPVVRKILRLAREEENTNA